MTLYSIDCHTRNDHRSSSIEAYYTPLRTSTRGYRSSSNIRCILSPFLSLTTNVRVSRQQRTSSRTTLLPSVTTTTRRTSRAYAARGSTSAREAQCPSPVGGASAPRHPAATAVPEPFPRGSAMMRVSRRGSPPRIEPVRRAG